MNTEATKAMNKVIDSLVDLDLDRADIIKVCRKSFDLTPLEASYLNDNINAARMIKELNA